MSVYKVPQDVEAEDKLLGPFSFRQFVFLIIAVIGIAIAYGLSTILLPLAIIPVPIILFFGALALPLKKDQPMEVYLASIASFYGSLFSGSYFFYAKTKKASMAA